MRTWNRSPKPNATHHTPDTQSRRASGALDGLQAAAEHSDVVKPLHTLQRLADQSSTAPQYGRARAGGIPDHLRTGIEALSGVSLEGVRVHRNSPKPAQLKAHAYAQGRDIHLASGQDRHLPHEAWHVVQQAKGQVRATTSEAGQAINDDPALEREATLMGARALSLATPPPHGGALQRVPNNTGPVQRVYATLPAMDKARVDQRADADYARKAVAFELGMAKKIMDNASVNGSIDILLAKVKRIVDQWAAHTGQQEAAVYEHEFGWPPGDGFYGAFEMTAENISAVFAGTDKPLRSKLKLIYNVVRNNALSKWLKVAGLELGRTARGKKPQSVKVRSQGVSVDRSGPAEKKVSKSKKETVKPGFAEASGIADFHDGDGTQELIELAKAEQRRTGMMLTPSRRNLFDHAHMSNAVGWKPATSKAHGERRGDASRGIAEDKQRHLTTADVTDLTDEEIDLMVARSGVVGSTPATRAMFRQTGPGIAPRNLSWSQGREYYDVTLGSDSAREAAKIKARMESGISGSTDLMMHAAEHLGVKGAVQKMPLRLALAGWMIAARDHSFYEVYKAAEAYGVPFNIDQTRPGSEYENLPNLIPMKRADFAGILPAEGGQANVFPAFYQSTTWKDQLAANPNLQGGNAAAVKANLTGSGVETLSLSVMDERDLAAMHRLKTVVTADAQLGHAEAQVRLLAMHRVKEDAAYIHLGNVYGAKRAERTLIELVSHIHNQPELTEFKPEDVPAKYRKQETEKQPFIARLRKAGLPDVVIDAASFHDLTGLDSLRHAIETSTPPAGEEFNAQPYITYLGDLHGPIRTDEDRKTMIVAALIRRYHPGAEPAALARHASALTRLRELEQVINMEQTTGTWYSWGPAASHQQKIQAPSLREATAPHIVDTPPQGPGLYIGRTVTASSSYGKLTGQRVLILKMRNVPTVNRHNAAQMERLDRILGYGNAPLEKSGLYEKKIRGEFLMIYGSGNYARLTTNQGVTLTMDLKQAPQDHLKSQFPQLGRWTGQSRQNFIDQAREHKLSLKKW